MEEITAFARERLTGARVQFDGRGAPTCLALGSEHSLVLAGTDDPQTRIVLALGVARTSRETLRGDPPFPHELERAISIAEDEVLGAQPILPASSALMVCSPDVSLMARLAQAGRQPHRLELAEVEALYQALARASERRAYTSDSPFRDPASWNAVLILREFMHHLGYQAAWLAP
ncbi:hypothetical protein H0Z60_15880 [Ectothiorhodospiraceae bacterium WFHF3C12]|nr:hypothetical protein [Ectothiorhodospiraceae bacterium WFHF3C12]